jgi:soluble P-type ATPase
MRILNYIGGGTAQTMASGNAVRAIQPMVGTEAARELQAIADEIAKAGGTPLAVAKDGRLLGVIHLKDIVKGGIRERFAELRRMGIRTVMITGDNPMTAAAIAAEAGVDDFLAQATPEDKLKLIRDEQAKGKLVAMCGDGTNDAPALAQADVGVAMNTGTQAAREAGNMVDLDSNPTKLIEVVEIGKQLLDDAWRADDVLDRQRRREILRHHPGDVPGVLPAARGAQRHASREPAKRDPVGDHLQRADHRRADSAGAEGSCLPRRRGRGAAAAATC